MKKAFDQTVRDLKREVNKKVLKVPGIEQKVLDATSNEPWGPHGAILADIAQATRNYHEYQMIMSVLWKRINDTGKNWRHVYKALTVLEYLVAHGSERVIDEIREHGYQISTLSEFQYIDSSGKDQGNNVRRKSQSLVVLVNDKERIIEVRQKAAANRDKFRTPSTGGMYRPGSGGYGDRYEDDRYGNRDDDRNGYGRDRDYNYKDDDRYGRYGDSYSRDGDRYGREYEDRYSRDGYRDDDYRGRSQSDDGYGSRGRSADRERNHGYDDDGQSSAHGSGARADDQSHDGRRLERKLSEQNIGAPPPPSYEEAVGESQGPVQSERNRETPASFAPGASSPTVPQTSPPAPKAASPPTIVNSSQAPFGSGISAPPEAQEVEVADEFDPRGPASAALASTMAPTVSAVPNTSNNAEMDLLGSLSDSFAPNPLAIMPVTSSATANHEIDSQTSFSGSPFDATQSGVLNQSFDDPFGDTPFKALPSSGAIPSHQQTSSPAPFQPTINQNAEILPGTAPNPESMNDYGSSSSISYSASTVQPPITNSQYLHQEPSMQHEEVDILADILPPSVPSTADSHPGFTAPTSQPAQAGPDIYGNFNSQAGPMVSVTSNTDPHASQFHSGNYFSQGGSAAPMASLQFNNENFLYQGGSIAHVPSSMAPQTPAGQSVQFNNGNFLTQPPSAVPVMSQIAHQTATGPTPPQLNNGNSYLQQGSMAQIVSQVGLQTATGSAAQPNNNGLGNLYPQGMNTSMASQASLPSSTGSLAIVTQPAKDKFETKSTVWADTLSRGLVNLNISGPKINPLSDIGIDFDSLNRKEKRMEKQPPPSSVTSTITMGKAMGSGSGIGRAGASVLRVPSNPMVGSGMSGGMNMGMGMVGAPGSGMGVGGYVGMNQQPMGMGMGRGMNMGVNMGMGQGGQMQPPGSAMPGGYNPMMGSAGGGYMPQQPYGGYR